ncbi:MAG: hypothetical protein KDD44_04030 [Bdellovibrionales bacterium]|nr:hypothetical protein [Bdellovibrionales bacterium]
MRRRTANVFRVGLLASVLWVVPSGAWAAEGSVPVWEHPEAKGLMFELEALVMKGRSLRSDPVGAPECEERARLFSRDVREFRRRTRQLTSNEEYAFALRQAAERLEDCIRCDDTAERACDVVASHLQTVQRHL